MPSKKATAASPSSRTGTSQREGKRLKTRAAVLAAALEEFRQHGFAAASTSRIATLAGVSHGTVFTVEPTKERLAAAAFDGQLRSIGEQALAGAMTSRSSLPERIWSVFNALFAFYADHQHIARVLLREMLLSTSPEGDSENDRLLRDYLLGLRRLIESSPSTGKQDGEALASAVFGIYLVFLLAQLNRVYPDKDTHSASCRRALNAVLQTQ